MFAFAMLGVGVHPEAYKEAEGDSERANAEMQKATAPPGLAL